MLAKSSKTQRERAKGKAGNDLDSVFGPDGKMSQKLKLTTKTDNQKLGQDEMKNFEVPVYVLREYSSCVKSFHGELQDMIVTALGVQIASEDSMVSWDHFVRLNALLRLDSATREEIIEFILMMFDPQHKKIIPRHEFDSMLNLLFGGGIKYKHDDIKAAAEEEEGDLAPAPISDARLASI